LERVLNALSVADFAQSGRAQHHVNSNHVERKDDAAIAGLLYDTGVATGVPITLEIHQICRAGLYTLCGINGQVRAEPRSPESVKRLKTHPFPPARESPSFRFSPK